MRETVSTKSKD